MAGDGVLGVLGARLTKSCCRGWGVQVPAGKTGLGDFPLLHQEQVPPSFAFGVGHPPVTPKLLQTLLKSHTRPVQKSLLGSRVRLST